MCFVNVKMFARFEANVSFHFSFYSIFSVKKCPKCRAVIDWAFYISIYRWEILRYIDTKSIYNINIQVIFQQSVL